MRDSNPVLSGSKLDANVPKAPTSRLEFPGKDSWEASAIAPGGNEPEPLLESALCKTHEVLEVVDILVLVPRSELEL